MRIIKIIETYFLEDDVWEGDFPRDDTRESVHVCDDTDEAVGVLQREGLSFAATGAEWAADPDGTRIVDYATAQRVETSGHLSGWSDSEAAEIMERVG